MGESWDYRASGPVTSAINTANAMVVKKTSTSAGAFTVPSNAKRISKIALASAFDGAATGHAEGVVVLSGNGLVDGEQAIPMHATGAGVTTSGASASAGLVIIPSDIRVVPGNQIFADYYYHGVDGGGQGGIVGLAFEVA